MFNSTPSLRIRSPSPTTVEFTVTTAPQNTFTRQMITYLTGLLRLFAIITTLFLLGLKYHPEPSLAFLPPQVQALLHTLLSVVSTATARLPWRYLLPASAGLLYASIFAGGYSEESLLVVRGLGVQISSTSWIRSSCRFIPTSRIGDLWIHEGFCGFEVRFYLAVVVEGEEGLVVVFPTLLPRRRVLELVWRGTKRCLYEQKRVGA